MLHCSSSVFTRLRLRKTGLHGSERRVGWSLVGWRSLDRQLDHRPSRCSRGQLACIAFLCFASLRCLQNTMHRSRLPSRIACPDSQSLHNRLFLALATKQVAAEAVKRGARMVDAPVSGGVGGAQGTRNHVLQRFAIESLVTFGDLFLCHSL